jgi:hypothetical protein
MGKGRIMPHGLKRRAVRELLRGARQLLEAIMREGKDSLTGEDAERARYVSYGSLSTLEAYLENRTNDPSYPQTAERLAEVAFGFGFDDLAQVVRERGL